MLKHAFENITLLSGPTLAGARSQALFVYLSSIQCSSSVLYHRVVGLGRPSSAVAARSARLIGEKLKPVARLESGLFCTNRTSRSIIF